MGVNDSPVHLRREAEVVRVDDEALQIPRKLLA